METAARRRLLRGLCQGSGAVRAPARQHPRTAAPYRRLAHAAREQDGESSTNSQKATAIYARAALTYFVSSKLSH